MLWFSQDHMRLQTQMKQQCGEDNKRPLSKHSLFMTSNHRAEITVCKACSFLVNHGQAGNCLFLYTVYTSARTNLIVAGNTLDWAELTEVLF